MKTLMLILALFFTCTIQAVGLKSLENLEVGGNHWIYEFTPSFNKGQLVIHVDLYFKMNSSGEMDIKLPNSWAKTENLFNGITNLTSNASFIQNDKKVYIYLVKANPNETVKISYDLISLHPGKLNSETNYYPLLEKDYALLLGGTFLVAPMADDNQEIKVDIHFTNFPKNWEMVSSFGADKTHHHFQGITQRFQSSVFALGKYKKQIIKIKNAPVYVMTKGTLGLPMKEIYQTVEKVITNHRTFFQDFDYPHFVITLLVTDEDSGTSGGTGRTNGFSTWVCQNFKDVWRLKHLLSHELFHNWNGRKILRQDPEELIYWFSEGFTDYFANFLNLQSGLITFKEFIANHNLIIRDYYGSKARNYHNDIIQKDFWNDRAVDRLPYQRGLLMATQWNMEIKQKNPQASFSNFFKDFFQESQSKGTIVTADNAARILKPYLGNKAKQDIQEFMIEGKTIPISDKALSPCASLIKGTTYLLDHGYDLKQSKKSKVITELKNQSELYNQGVRNGDKLTNWDMDNNVDHLQIISIEKDGKKKEYKYYPRGEPLKVPQYKIVKNDKSCLDWFKI